MTFEKESDDAISIRTHEHFTSIWASLFAGAVRAGLDPPRLARLVG